MAKALTFYNQRKVVQHGQRVAGLFVEQAPRGLEADEVLVAIVAKNTYAEARGVTRIAHQGLATAIDITDRAVRQQVLLDHRAGRWSDVAVYAVKVEHVLGSVDEVISWVALEIR